VKRQPAPLQPRNPERICWGCDTFCPADDLACGNGTIRTPHPQELFGDDWLTWCESLADTPDSRFRNGRERSALLDALLPPDPVIEGDDVAEQEGVEDEEHT
jgi:hypothetical protein